MEAAPMVIAPEVGARFATVATVEFFWFCFLGIVFCGCCEVIVEILRSFCGVTYISGALGASGGSFFLVGVVLAVGVRLTSPEN